MFAAFLNVLRITYFLRILTQIAVASPRNITIDDEAGDELNHAQPMFSPAGRWAQGANCPGCVRLDDPSKARNGTWHDSTHHPSDVPRVVTFSFAGTAIYVYCILANIPVTPPIDTLANYTFAIDGALVGSFTHIPEDKPDFQYNTLVYSNTSIPPGIHSFQLVADSEVNTTLILFDYAQYTVDIDDPTSAAAATPTTLLATTSAASSNTPAPSSTHIVEIVAGILGGVSIIGIGMILYLLRHRLRFGRTGRQQNPEDSSHSDPSARLSNNTVNTPSAASRTVNGRLKPEPGPLAITPFLLHRPRDQGFQKERTEQPATNRRRGGNVDASTPTSSRSTDVGSGRGRRSRERPSHHRRREREEATSSGNVNSGPTRASASRQVSFKDATEGAGSNRTGRHTRHREGTNSEYSVPESATSTTLSEGAVTPFLLQQPLNPRSEKGKIQQSFFTVPISPITDRGEGDGHLTPISSTSANSELGSRYDPSRGRPSPNSSRPSEESSRPTAIGQSPLRRPIEPDARPQAEVPSQRSANRRNREARRTRRTDSLSSPASSRRTQASELDSLRQALQDLRSQQEIMMSVLQPPPSYE